MLKEELSTIKERIKSSLLQFPDSVQFNYIHFALLEKVIEELGWELDWDDFDSNGWEYDFWIKAIIPDKDFYYMISGSWYYSDTKLDKRYDN